MNTCFQAVPLVAAPSYPNAIAWSDENLIAVASGHLVTIMNPTLPIGARGIITIPTDDLFPIGVIERKDLFSGCMLPICLSRDRRPCVRSIAWSPLGMAPNGGCLLAVCTTAGRVKLYRPPFCDFSAEWIEIVDISNKLYNYLASIKFGELDIPCSKFSEIPAKEDESADCFPKHSPKEGSKQRKRRADNLKSCSKKGSRGFRDQSSLPQDDANCNFESQPPDLLAPGSPMFNESSLSQPLEKTKEKPPRKPDARSTLPLISAHQYSSSTAMLSSLVISWSPLMSAALEVHPRPNSSVSVLAVGGKSGKVSIWKVNSPERYSVAECVVQTRVVLVGLLHAHNSWVNCISWALIDSDSSNAKALLATGSTDGSVKVWQCSCEELLASSESNFASFSLLTEINSGEAVPVMHVSMNVPNLSLQKLFLAVGRGSGSFEIKIINIANGECDNVGLYDAHDHAVTGLAWAFDGRYLYSCSEDNILRGWNLDGRSLHEVSISPSTPHLRSSIDLPEAFRSCLGIAVSPGNLVAAVVRNFDLELLHPMYQARAQKAAVEFFSIGGLEIEATPNSSSSFQAENIPYFSKEELARWESSIFWSLKQLENLDKPLVAWDIGATLLAFRQSIPEYVEHILHKWLATSYGKCEKDLSAENILLYVSRNVSTFSTRQLHLLNIVCRRVVLSEIMQDQANDKIQNFEVLDDTDDESYIPWKKLLISSERELRQRLVGLSFFACIKLASPPNATIAQQNCWYPTGLVEMQQWVGHNRENLRESLKVIASEAEKHHRSEDSATEQCIYCSSSVPFESPEVGFCEGQNHKLIRCSATMQVCPATPLWFCVCCYRWTFKLAPKTLFQMSDTSIFSSLNLSDPDIPLKPLCPFCGILLQRRLPEFLLSASPV